MKAKLIVVGGDAKAAEIKLKLPTVIGRGREANLTLPHPLVSRKHCELFEDQGRLWVRDLGSLNGTYVNNERIADSTLLPSGDLLTVGAVTFRAVYADQASLNPPAPGDATVRGASSTTIEPPSRVHGRADQSTEVEPALFHDLNEGADQEKEAEEGEEGLEVDELDKVEIEELADEEIEDVSETGPAPAKAAAPLTPPLATDPLAQTAPAPPVARAAPRASDPAGAAQANSEETGLEHDEFESFDADEAEDLGFLNEAGPVDDAASSKSPGRAELPGTINVPPPAASPGGAAPGGAAPGGPAPGGPAPGGPAPRGAGGDTPDDNDDDALNQFLKGLR